ncbi:MAG: hypothetical protein Kow0080_33740 [Candidatus Promineifilaceae bacterium]
MNNPQSPQQSQVTDPTQDNPRFHLPLDEIRHNPEKGHSYTANIGSVPAPAVVYGNPRVVHTPDMGTCMVFNGKDEYVELVGLDDLALSDGFSVAAWLRMDDASGARQTHIFALGRKIEDKERYAGKLTYHAQTQILYFNFLDKIIHIPGIVAGQWIHFAAAYNNNGSFQIFARNKDGEAYDDPQKLDHRLRYNTQSLWRFFR